MKLFRSNGTPRQSGTTPRHSQTKPGKPIAALIEGMTVERVAMLAGLPFNAAKRNEAANDYRYCFVLWAKDQLKEVPPPRWATEYDAWLDYRIAMKATKAEGTLAQE
jgi:hypothetical protein